MVDRPITLCISTSRTLLSISMFCSSQRMPATPAPLSATQAVEATIRPRKDSSGLGGRAAAASDGLVEPASPPAGEPGGAGGVGPGPHVASPALVRPWPGLRPHSLVGADLQCHGVGQGGVRAWFTGPDFLPHAQELGLLVGPARGLQLAPAGGARGLGSRSPHGTAIQALSRERTPNRLPVNPYNAPYVRVMSC